RSVKLKRAPRTPLAPSRIIRALGDQASEGEPAAAGGGAGRAAVGPGALAHDQGSGCDPAPFHRGRVVRQGRRAWADLIPLVGVYEDRPDEALGLRAAAEAALVRAGDGDELRGQLLVAIGMVGLTTHDYSEAERAFASALALCE